MQSDAEAWIAFQRLSERHHLFDGCLLLVAIAAGVVDALEGRQKVKASFAAFGAFVDGQTECLGREL